MPKRERYAIQTADQAVNNSTTLVDSELSVNVEAGRVYHVVGYLTVDDTVVSLGMDVKISLPAGATLVARRFDNAFANPIEWDGSEVTLSENDGTVHFAGRIVVGVTAGKVTVQFAQNAAGVGNTLLKKNSTMSLERISQGAA
jgi:hypothetical protein